MPSREILFQMGWQKVASKFVRYMDRVGDQDLQYREGELRSPGCEGDYRRCSQVFDLEQLRDALEDALKREPDSSKEAQIHV